MCKRLWKNVILAVCILAVVLHPVTSFASNLVYDPSTLGKFVYVLEGDTAYPNNYMSQYDLAMFYDILDHFVGSYPYLSSAAADIDNATNMIYYKNSSYYYLVAPDPALGNMQLYMNSSGNIYTVFNGSTTGTPVINFQYRISTQAYSTSMRNTLNSTSYPYYITSDITMNDGRAIFVSASSGSPSEYPDISDLNGYTITAPATPYIQLGSYIRQLELDELRRKWPAVYQGLNNNEWAVIGSTDEEKVKYAQILALQIDLQELIESLAVHSYDWMNNLSGNLASFANNQNTIQEYMSSIIPDISNIESGISDINDRLETAFPDDQAAMNDSIADQILDDTNDTGLTVNRVTSAKSNLDDGLTTFKLETSGSQYSNPFSALDDADWSFWSQTTLNNLGSGYSYSFSEGSLMSDNDVFTENQSVLLNLLGW